MNIERPTDIPDTGLLCDVLWSDPKVSDEHWEENERGVSFTFNGQVVEDFCNKNEIDRNRPAIAMDHKHQSTNKQSHLHELIDSVLIAEWAQPIEGQ